MPIFLEYGINEHGGLQYITDTQRGKTPLTCPYCGGLLTAKKGRKITHHFAHTGETCRAVASRDMDSIKLPAYDRFGLELTAKELEELQHVAQTTSVHHNYRYLEANGFIDFSEYRAGLRSNAGWSLTHKGKIPFGECTLSSFATIQDELIRAKHEWLENSAQWAKGKPDFDMLLTDLKLYRAQLRRILAASLYFLEITHAGGVIYKIGVTTRSIDERIAEIQHDLALHLQDIAIEPLRVLTHRGGVELYFKYRYKVNQQPIGGLTEYFTFDQRRGVLSDLTKLGDKGLTDFEAAVLAGEPSQLEIALSQEREAAIALEAEQERRAAIKTGMQAAAHAGKHIGRPPETDQQTLERHAGVVRALQDGLSLRQAATAAGVSVNTVRKVKALLEQHS